MTRPIDLMREGRKEELWQMCCGFLDLSLDQFMSIQKRLLREQMELLKQCELGRRVMGGAMPETVEEFREQVPLTTYSDYLPDLVEKREEVLPVKPAMWAHTVGRAGEYIIKAVPVSDSSLREFEKVAGGVSLIASCDSRGDFLAKEHVKTFSPTGSRYYGSGIVGYMAQQALGCDLLSSNANGCSLESAKGSPLEQKIIAGFQEALYRGLDAIGGLPSVLVHSGEMLTRGAMSVNARFLLSHPKAAFRLARALIRSKLAGRAMLPKDLWSVKVALGGGADSAAFGKRVQELWGRSPLELYAGVDGGIYATQTWDYEGMTFIPNLNFFEFIPEREWFKWQLDHSYRPQTVLLDELKAGEIYEIVITNLHGGVLTRCRIGDMIRIVSLRNERLDIDIPQMVFHGRADDLVDIAGLGRITERIIGEAVENTGIPLVDWVARKEFVDDKPVLHLYLELADGYIAGEASVAAAAREQLRRLDRRYRCNFYSLVGNMEATLGLNPLQVTFLPRGAFAAYAAQRHTEGATLSGLNAPRVNPSDEALSSLTTPKVVVVAAPATESERLPAQ